MAWDDQPVVYEIHTWVWLADLAARLGRPVTLGTVPGEVWDDVCRPGVDAVWLMGVWERSAVGAAIGRVEPGFRDAHVALLPGYTDDDVVGSPYCIRRYEVDPRLGGTAELAIAREQLARRGAALVLDFVPNHVAPDHPWALGQPDLMVHGTEDERAADPHSFRRVGDHVLASGRDPYFPAWTDVVQVNAFAPGLRAAAAEQLRVLGERCDGLRCDMAMLLLNDVFERTWGDRVGPPPATEYWADVIGEARRHHPGLRLVAEAYWDLERRLVDLGFDACYDKRLYDRLSAGDAEGVRAHLAADPEWQRRTVRFTENHDEPRAAAALGPAARAAAVVVATVPGTTLWHEGQFEGRRVRVPVLLGRRPEEAPDEASRAFHHRLLAVAPELRQGSWQLAATSGWPGNGSHRRLLAWTWTSGTSRSLVVVNLADTPSQGMVRLPWTGPGPSAGQVRMDDPLSGERFTRDAGALAADGLFVDLPAWATHVLGVTSYL